MDIINETLKYLETDENKQPKYRFEIYKSGISTYYKDKLKALSRGLISNDSSNEETIPVTVYTIGDVFDTVSGTYDDVIKNISALPGTLDNIKFSLKQLGFTALDTAIDTIKTAVVPIEVIQSVNEVYRVARPLFEKIVDIAAIMFHFENAYKVAQDILQYLSRVAVSTAKNYLDRLWTIFLDTPIFAIYENDETVNLSNAYATFADEANKLIDDLVKNSGAFYEIMNYANSAGVKTYEPKYSELGINIDDDIVDVYSDINTRKIYIASSHKVYQVTKDYLASEIFKTEDTIKNLFCYENEVYYIVGNNVIKRIVSETESRVVLNISGANFEVVFGNPVFILNKSNGYIYKPTSSDPFKLIGDVKFHTYNADNDIIYFIVESSGVYKLLALSKDTDGAYHNELLSSVSNTPYGMSYFDGVIYIVLKDSSNKYYVSKISAGLSFNRNLYSFDRQPKDSILWVDDAYATDGSSIYTNSNGSMTYVTPTYNSVNCVTRKSYQGADYYVCSGGIHIYCTKIIYNSGIYAYRWNTKELIADISNEERITIPDNISGLKWYNSDAYGQFLLATSQNHIYVFGPDRISQIFDVEEPEAPKPLVYKEFASFDDWFNYGAAKNNSIVFSSKFDVKDGAVITSVNVIGKQIYVALFSPKYYAGSTDIIKCGVYKAAVNFRNGVYGINIDYGNPVFTLNSKIKIYSFINKDNCWYCSDGNKLYNVTYNSEMDLEINSKEIADRALFLSNKNNNFSIYTAKSKMNVISNEQYGEVTSLANYKSTALPQIASTRNILMFSDTNYVYSIVNNGDNAINADIFQICYKKSAFDYRLIQSCDGVFIVSKNSIKKIPFYSSITSSNYGCGYYTDTTPNKWYGAAPYYFSSNVLNEKKNSSQKSLFLLSFRENFKVELTKLLKNIPDAFVKYTQDKLATELRKLGVEIEGDDGQIVDLIIKSVSSTTANSMGMYIQEKFFEKIGDDSTYETFATQVYNACLADSTNNMTKDFYDIFESLYYSTIADALLEKNIGKNGLSNSLLRYYQNHKAEWAESMTDLIDVDVVDPEYYNIPLDSTQQVSNTTYRFSYLDNEYKYEYISNPSSRFLNKNIISGYLYDGEFYEDPEHTIVIDSRTKIGDDYYDENGNIICFGDGEGNFYTYKLQNYVLTEDTEVDPNKDYYIKSGDNQYIYSLTEDTEVQPNKPYFVNGYSASEDTEVNPEKTYYTKQGGSYEYTLMTREHEIYPGVLPNNSYFVKQEYALTTDTEVDESKTYYTESYQQASGSVEIGVQYYKQDYVPTSDTEIDLSKNYYEFLDLSEFAGQELYDYNPSASGTKYSLNYVQAGSLILEPDTTYYIKDGDTYYDADLNEDGSNYDPDRTYYTRTSYTIGEDTRYIYTPTYIHVVNSNLDPTETYYTRSGESGSYVYTVAENIDEQYGPYFKVKGFVVDPNGSYVKTTVSAGATIYTLVTNPSLNNLASYYELDYVPVVEPSSTAGLFIKGYNIIIEPEDADISTYYEKSNSYAAATDLVYVYDNTGNISGIKNDRNLYAVSYAEEVYTVVDSPSGSPKDNGYYEKNTFTQTVNEINNPHDEGLFERNLNEVAFTLVENPVVEDLPTYYEYTYSYSTPYNDGKVYIDLSATSYDSNFDVEDTAWHESFYTSVADAKEEVTSEDLDEAKAQALAALNGLVYIVEPSAEWQMLITKSVTEYYIPKQGDQFRQIIYNSDMYPIQWDELPEKIDHDAFDYALTALLYAIKQRLMTNITILVDGGKVKCYSCVDASTVIRKMMERNGVIWSNQIKFAKSKVTKATSVDEVKKAFDMIKTFDPSRNMLEKLLIKQSRLYSSYIDQIIEVQVINDNETEVMM